MCFSAEKLLCFNLVNEKSLIISEDKLELKSLHRNMLQTEVLCTCSIIKRIEVRASCSICELKTVIDTRKKIFLLKWLDWEHLSLPAMVAVTRFGQKDNLTAATPLPAFERNGTSSPVNFKTNLVRGFRVS